MALSRVLLPLDGSPLSLHGLKLFEAVAREDSELVLFRVVSSADSVPKVEAKLKKLAAELGPHASVQVEVGEDPAGHILAAAATRQADLVVLMTHGRGGLKRWMWGSVAEHVARHCQVPLLLGTPARVGGDEAAPRRILVPLDGSDLARLALEPVKALAAATRAEVVLFSAFWADPTDNPVAFTRALSVAQATAEQLLEKEVEELVEDGVKASAFVKRGEPAGAILDAAEAIEADLIAMTTHGRSGVRRWLLGSVAERVLRASPLPVLLVRGPMG